MNADRNRLFLEKDTVTNVFERPRTGGRLKSILSVTDNRAWQLDDEGRRRHLLDVVNNPGQPYMQLCELLSLGILSCKSLAGKQSETERLCLCAEYLRKKLEIYESLNLTEEQKESIASKLKELDNNFDVTLDNLTETEQSDEPAQKNLNSELTESSHKTTEAEDNKNESALSPLTSESTKFSEEVTSEIKLDRKSLIPKLIESSHSVTQRQIQFNYQPTMTTVDEEIAQTLDELKLEIINKDSKIISLENKLAAAHLAFQDELNKISKKVQSIDADTQISSPDVLTEELKKAHELNEKLQQELVNSKSLKNEEIHNLKSEMDSLKAHCNEVLTKQEEFERITKERNLFEVELKMLKDSYNELLSKYNDLKEDYAKLEGELDTKQGELNGSCCECDTLKDENKILKDKLNKIVSEHDEIRRRNETLKEHVETLKNKPILSHLQNEHSLEEAVKLLKEENKRLTQHLEEALNGNNDFGQRLKKAEDDFTELQNKTQVTLAQLDESLNKIDTLNQEICNLEKQICQLKSERDRLRASVQEKQLEIDQLNCELYEAREKLIELDLIQEQTSVKDIEIQRLKCDVDELKDMCDCIRKQNMDYDELNQKYEELKKVLDERDVIDTDLTKLDQLQDEIERLRFRAKEADCLRLERDCLQNRIDQLTAIEIEFYKLSEKTCNIDTIKFERDLYRKRFEDEEKIKNDLNRTVSKMENEIKNLMIQLEYMTKGNEIQQKRTAEALNELRAELESKNCKIAMYEDQLRDFDQVKEEIQELQEQLKKTIETVEERDEYKALSDFEQIEKELMKIIDELTTKNENLEQKISYLEAQLCTYEAIINKADHNCNEYENILQKMKCVIIEKEKLENIIRDYEAKLRNCNCESESELTEKQIEKTIQNYSHFENVIEQLETKNRYLSEKLRYYEGKTTEFENIESEFTENYDLFMKVIEDLLKQNENFEKRIAELKYQFEECICIIKLPVESEEEFDRKDEEPSMKTEYNTLVSTIKDLLVKNEFLEAKIRGYELKQAKPSAMVGSNSFDELIHYLNEKITSLEHVTIKILQKEASNKSERQLAIEEKETDETSLEEILTIIKKNTSNSMTHNLNENTSVSDQIMENLNKRNHVIQMALKQLNQIVADRIKSGKSTEEFKYLIRMIAAENQQLQNIVAEIKNKLIRGQILELDSTFKQICQENAIEFGMNTDKNENHLGCQELQDKILVYENMIKDYEQATERFETDIVTMQFMKLYDYLEQRDSQLQAEFCTLLADTTKSNNVLISDFEKLKIKNAYLQEIFEEIIDELKKKMQSSQNLYLTSIFEQAQKKFIRLQEIRTYCYDQFDEQLKYITATQSSTDLADLKDDIFLKTIKRFQDKLQEIDNSGDQTTEFDVILGNFENALRNFDESFSKSSQTIVNSLKIILKNKSEIHKHNSALQLLIDELKDSLRTTNNQATQDIIEGLQCYLDAEKNRQKEENEFNHHMIVYAISQLHERVNVLCNLKERLNADIQNIESKFEGKLCDCLTKNFQLQERIVELEEMLENINVKEHPSTLLKCLRDLHNKLNQIDVENITDECLKRTLIEIQNILKSVKEVISLQRADQDILINAYQQALSEVECLRNYSNQLQEENNMLQLKSSGTINYCGDKTEQTDAAMLVNCLESRIISLKKSSSLVWKCQDEIEKHDENVLCQETPRSLDNESDKEEFCECQETFTECAAQCDLESDETPKLKNEISCLKHFADNLQNQKMLPEIQCTCKKHPKKIETNIENLSETFEKLKQENDEIHSEIGETKKYYEYEIQNLRDELEKLLKENEKLKDINKDQDELMNDLENKLAQTRQENRKLREISPKVLEVNKIQSELDQLIAKCRCKANKQVVTKEFSSKSTNTIATVSADKSTSKDEPKCRCKERPKTAEKSEIVDKSEDDGTDEDEGKAPVYEHFEKITRQPVSYNYRPKLKTAEVGLNTDAVEETNITTNTDLIEKNTVDQATGTDVIPKKVVDQSTSTDVIPKKVVNQSTNTVVADIAEEIFEKPKYNSEEKKPTVTNKFSSKSTNTVETVRVDKSTSKDEPKCRCKEKTKAAKKFETVGKSEDDTTDEDDGRLPVYEHFEKVVRQPVHYNYRPKLKTTEVSLNTDVVEAATIAISTDAVKATPIAINTDQLQKDIVDQSTNTDEMAKQLVNQSTNTVVIDIVKAISESKCRCREKKPTVAKEFSSKSTNTIIIARVDKNTFKEEPETINKSRKDEKDEGPLPVYEDFEKITRQPVGYNYRPKLKTQETATNTNVVEAATVAINTAQIQKMEIVDQSTNTDDIAKLVVNQSTNTVVLDTAQVVAEEPKCRCKEKRQTASKQFSSKSVNTITIVRIDKSTSKGESEPIDKSRDGSAQIQKMETANKSTDTDEIAKKVAKQSTSTVVTDIAQVIAEKLKCRCKEKRQPVTKQFSSKSANTIIVVKADKSTSKEELETIDKSRDKLAQSQKMEIADKSTDTDEITKKVVNQSTNTVVIDTVQVIAEKPKCRCKEKRQTAPKQFSSKSVNTITIVRIDKSTSKGESEPIDKSRDGSAQIQKMETANKSTDTDEIAKKVANQSTSTVVTDIAQVIAEKLKCRCKEKRQPVTKQFSSKSANTIIVVKADKSTSKEETETTAKSRDGSAQIHKKEIVDQSTNTDEMTKQVMNQSTSTVVLDAVQVIAEKPKCRCKEKKQKEFTSKSANTITVVKVDKSISKEEPEAKRDVIDEDERDKSDEDDGNLPVYEHFEKITRHPVRYNYRPKSKTNETATITDAVEATTIATNTDQIEKNIVEQSTSTDVMDSARIVSEKIKCRCKEKKEILSSTTTISISSKEELKCRCKEKTRIQESGKVDPEKFKCRCKEKKQNITESFSSTTTILETPKEKPEEEPQIQDLEGRRCLRDSEDTINKEDEIKSAEILSESALPKPETIKKPEDYAIDGTEQELPTTESVSEDVKVEDVPKQAINPEEIESAGVLSESALPKPKTLEKLENYTTDEIGVNTDPTEQVTRAINTEETEENMPTIKKLDQIAIKPQDGSTDTAPLKSVTPELEKIEKETMTESLQDLDKESLRKVLDESVTSLKRQYDRDIKSILSKHDESIASLAQMHEESLHSVIKEYEKENDSLRDTVNDLKAQLEKDRKMPREQITTVDLNTKLKKCMLSKVVFETANIQPSTPCPCSPVSSPGHRPAACYRRVIATPSLATIIEKILYEGIEQLSIQELTYLHSRTCKVAKDKVRQKDIKSRMVDEIKNLEKNLIRKQRDAAEKIKALQETIYREKQKLMNLKSLYTKTECCPCQPKIIRKCPCPRSSSTNRTLRSKSENKEAQVSKEKRASVRLRSQEKFMSRPKN